MSDNVQQRQKQPLLSPPDPVKKFGERYTPSLLRGSSWGGVANAARNLLSERFPVCLYPTSHHSAECKRSSDQLPAHRHDATQQVLSHLTPRGERLILLAKFIYGRTDGCWRNHRLFSHCQTKAPHNLCMGQRPSFHEPQAQVELAVADKRRIGKSS